MNRREMIEICKRSPDIWDILIIGGGATGLGALVDASARGYKTLLLEQSDFAKGTSSRSTKLIHGGLRYLKQGRLGLVIEALKERGLLCQNAPHLVSSLGFLIPSYRWWEKPFYGIGLKVYDFLAGKLGLEKSHSITRAETLLRMPTLEPAGLRGAVIYYDGQFDDARLAIALAQTAFDNGGYLLNYCRVEKFLKKDGFLTGVEACDLETGERYELRGKIIINATGVFTDSIRKLDDLAAVSMVTPSQGVHLVLDRSFMPSDLAIIIPETEDGRFIFFVPWHRHLLVGTTDTPIKDVSLEPVAQDLEIDYLLKYSGHYLTRKPKRSDILSVFAGLRPLVKSGGGKASANTAALARDHVIQCSESNLITICGGKWTTYRRMAEDVVNKAIAVANLPPRHCPTHSLPLHGYRKKGRHHVDSWIMYGSDAEKLDELIQKHPDWGHLLHPRLPYLPVEIVWAVRQEMARTLEDVLSRRTRALLLDARAALEIAPRVAALMAKELGKPKSWEEEQIQEFSRLANKYL
jgi:glycerol-3-phosphate dehydrogenase